ncbi:P-type conjugative transfer protein TrbJ [Pseudomonas duriflava]|uniref:P-type conjugative transfer protein TrbJ n=1 Tax=Pseudomonas duriflava TaxID=459528 RepID=A0A562PP80_9PSED|nr:P-type conjugative transfer protein TrbJ [Pseudomonas duriflava]TWI46168.1 P-type conjugative transfer protein TrbJ [Pseudomonas duriflava]
MKRTLAAKKTGLAVFVLSAIIGGPALAGIPVIDGSNLSQTTISAIQNVAMQLKQLEQYAQQVLQYKTQLDQLEDQIRNTAAPAAYLWDQVNDITKKIVAAQDMVDYYSNQAGSLEAYLDKYKNTSYYSSSPCYALPGGCTESQAAANEAQQRANNNAMQTISLQQKQLQTDASNLTQLQAQAQSATGRMQAMGYANQIASTQANQLMQIRSLLLAQQQVLTAQSMAQQNREAQQQAADKSATAGNFVKSEDTGW